MPRTAANPTTAVIDAANGLADPVRQNGATVTIASGDKTASITPDAVSGEVGASPAGRPYAPPDSSFGDDDFQKAPELEKIGDGLRTRYEEFAILEKADIEFRWKRAGGKSHGKLTFGKCVKTSGALRHFARCDFLIWVAADHVREEGFTNLQLEALVYHQLKHIDLEVNDDETSPDYGQETFILRGHDAELFLDDLRRYGAWRPSLERVGEEFKQLALAAGAVA